MESVGNDGKGTVKTWTQLNGWVIHRSTPFPFGFYEGGHPGYRNATSVPFDGRNATKDETVRAYAVQLQTLMRRARRQDAQICTDPDKALRDQFVEGLRDKDITLELLRPVRRQETFTFAEVKEEALALVEANTRVRGVQTSALSVFFALYVNTPKPFFATFPFSEEINFKLQCVVRAAISDTFYRGGQPKLLDSHEDHDSRQSERSEDEGSSEDSEDEDGHQSSVSEDERVTTATTMAYREGSRLSPPQGDCVLASRINLVRIAAAQSTALPGREGSRPHPPSGDCVWASRFNLVPVRISY
uniref:Uncharacterized protein n=1 Tax=Branchiostoma floridae TaxID=7739 RepID=C3Y830_BRAFL|eukprot:XP_002607489.1 hypothetical protein BRAFLDRAFT_69921 [Branchiostoma floridae]